ncbi:MAG TPA: hypothetical protein VGZ04_08850 [Acidimicrobiales bacterium]|nr:hypothetical protein [Acidimicrobiales bacterium]
MAIVLVAGTFFAESSSRGATTTAPAGLPMYQFVETGVQPLPWNAVSLKSQLNATTMLGGPHGATSGTLGVLAYRTNDSHLALFTQRAGGVASWTDFTPQNDVPTPAADPIPFFDPSNNVDLLYVDDRGHVILLSPNDPNTTIWARLHHDTPWRPFVTTDLTALTGVLASNGLPSIQITGTTGTVAYRTANNTIEVLTLTFVAGQPIPVYAQNAFNVTSVSTSTPPTTSTTTTTKPTTTTTKPPATTTTSPTSTSSTTTTTKPPTTTTTKPVNATAFGSDPVVLPGPSPSFAANLNNGDLAVYTNVGTSIRTWSAQNLTTLTGTPTLSGSLALGASAASIDVAALTSGGSVELFTTPYSAVPVYHVWNVQNVTSLAVGAPPLTGTLSVQVTPSQVAVAGQAANWGDLFVLTSVAGASPWTSTDVSVTAGSSARSVGSVVAGLQINGQLTLYAAGLNSPPRQGVGVYAIPSAKWTKAIGDGWPIISETGGLGTRSAPWVGFTGSPSVSTSPDYLLGQSIYNAHKRVTWLDFWTVSGPLASQPMTTSNYYDHGFAAGAWVATQIDSYRALGVGLKPDWVIFDPEGYPDNHSGLDAPGGSSLATMAKYATYWSSMVKGWQEGLNSIDPSLNAGVYASQSEYRNYQLSTLSLPVFMAIAFGGGGPIPVAGASGSNVRGFISFDAVCTPASTLQAEATTLLNPPWGGQFNTLQFNAGVYCPPPLT